MKRILLSMLMVALLSCDDNADTCNISDPVNDLEWLRAEIEGIENDKANDPMYQYRFFARGYQAGKIVFFSKFMLPAV